MPTLVVTEPAIKRTTSPEQQPKIEDGLTAADLSRLFGFFKIDPETGEEKRSGAVTNATNKDREKPGYFAEWSRQYDEEGRSWRYDGVGKKRRYYPIDEEIKAVSGGEVDE